MEVMNNLILVKGRIAGSRSPASNETHWSPDGKATLCGISVLNRVNAMNPAKCISCRKCSRKQIAQWVEAQRT